MDKLDTIFEYQKKFDDEITEKRALDFTFEEWIQKDTLAMMSELSELIDEVNFKWWKNEKPLDMDALKEELVDILHFFISMCHRSGMDGSELLERYLKKNAENFARQNGTSDKPGYKLEGK